jgi:HK97 gp10 family phage protein
VITTAMTVDGFDEVIAMIERLGDLPADRVEGVLLAAALPMAADMSSRAARSTEPRRRHRGKARPAGHMADSIKPRPVEEDRGGIVRVSVGPGRAFFWAGFVEFGTSKMPAEPFVRPAFDSGKEAAATAIQHGLISLVQELAGAR